MILPCGAATSQDAPDWLLNDQTQVTSVISDLELNVVEATDATTGTSAAVGNQTDSRSEAAFLDMRSNQRAQAPVDARTRLNVTANASDSTQLSTSAHGNVADAAVARGGVMTGVYTQTVTGGPVRALSQIEGATARAGDVSVDVTARGSSQRLSADYASTGARINQSSTASVSADGGGVLNRVTGQASFNAVAQTNAAGISGTNGAAQRVIVQQRSAGPETLAAQFTAFGSSYLTATTTGAAANTVEADNSGPLLDLTSSQTNTAYVRSQAETSSFAFSRSEAEASGVGNNLNALDLNGQLRLDTAQVNDGAGVEAIARFTGDNGYDGYATARATGNQVQAQACGDCVGLWTESRQTSNADVGARATLTATGPVRSLSGSASAVGNSSSYYVSRGR